MLGPPGSRKAWNTMEEEEDRFLLSSVNVEQKEQVEDENPYMTLPVETLLSLLNNGTIEQKNGAASGLENLASTDSGRLNISRVGDNVYDVLLSFVLNHYHDTNTRRLIAKAIQHLCKDDESREVLLDIDVYSKLFHLIRHSKSAAVLPGIEIESYQISQTRVEVVSSVLGILATLIEYVSEYDMYLSNLPLLLVLKNIDNNAVQYYSIKIIYHLIINKIVDVETHMDILPTICTILNNNDVLYQTKKLVTDILKDAGINTLSQYVDHLFQYARDIPEMAFINLGVNNEKGYYSGAQTHPQRMSILEEIYYILLMCSTRDINSKLLLIEDNLRVLIYALQLEVSPQVQAYTASILANLANNVENHNLLFTDVKIFRYSSKLLLNPNPQVRMSVIRLLANAANNTVMHRRLLAEHVPWNAVIVIQNTLSMYSLSENKDVAIFADDFEAQSYTARRLYGSLSTLHAARLCALLSCRESNIKQLSQRLCIGSIFHCLTACINESKNENNLSANKLSINDNHLDELKVVFNDNDLDVRSAIQYYMVLSLANISSVHHSHRYILHTLQRDGVDILRSMLQNMTDYQQETYISMSVLIKNLASNPKNLIHNTLHSKHRRLFNDKDDLFPIHPRYLFKVVPILILSNSKLVIQNCINYMQLVLEEDMLKLISDSMVGHLINFTKQLDENDDKIQCLVLLTRLCHLNSTKLKVFRSHLDDVLEIFQKYTEQNINILLRRTVCKWISTLSRLPEIQEELCSEDFMQVLIKCRQSTDSIMEARALEIFSNICGNEELVYVLKRFDIESTLGESSASGNSVCRKFAFQNIANLAAHSECRISLRKLNLTELFMNFFTDARGQSRKSDIEEKRMVVLSLANCLRHNINHSTLITRYGVIIDRLFTLCESADSDLLRHTAQLIANMTAGHPNHPAFCNPNVVKHLIRMARLSYDPLTKHHCITSLHALSVDPSNYELLLRCEVSDFIIQQINTIVPSLVKHRENNPHRSPKSKNIDDENNNDGQSNIYVDLHDCLFALKLVSLTSDLSQSNECCHRFVEEGIITPLTQLLWCHDKAIVTHIMSTLCNIASNNDCRVALIVSNGQFIMEIIESLGEYERQRRKKANRCFIKPDDIIDFAPNNISETNFFPIESINHLNDEENNTITPNDLLARLIIEIIEDEDTRMQLLEDMTMSDILLYVHELFSIQDHKVNMAALLFLARTTSVLLVKKVCKRIVVNDLPKLFKWLSQLFIDLKDKTDSISCRSRQFIIWNLVNIATCMNEQPELTSSCKFVFEYFFQTYKVADIDTKRVLLKLIASLSLSPGNFKFISKYFTIAKLQELIDPNSHMFENDDEVLLYLSEIFRNFASSFRYAKDILSNISILKHLSTVMTWMDVNKIPSKIHINIWRAVTKLLLRLTKYADYLNQLLDKDIIKCIVHLAQVMDLQVRYNSLSFILTLLKANKYFKKKEKKRRVKIEEKQEEEKQSEKINDMKKINISDQIFSLLLEQNDTLEAFAKCIKSNNRFIQLQVLQIVSQIHHPYSVLVEFLYKNDVLLQIQSIVYNALITVLNDVEETKSRTKGGMESRLRRDRLHKVFAIDILHYVSYAIYHIAKEAGMRKHLIDNQFVSIILQLIKLNEKCGDNILIHNIMWLNMTSLSLILKDPYWTMSDQLILPDESELTKWQWKCLYPKIKNLEETLSINIGNNNNNNNNQHPQHSGSRYHQLYPLNHGSTSLKSRRLKSKASSMDVRADKKSKKKEPNEDVLNVLRVKINWKLNDTPSTLLQLIIDSIIRLMDSSNFQLKRIAMSCFFTLLQIEFSWRNEMYKLFNEKAGSILLLQCGCRAYNEIEYKKNNKLSQDILQIFGWLSVALLDSGFYFGSTSLISTFKQHLIVLTDKLIQKYEKLDNIEQWLSQLTVFLAQFYSKIVGMSNESFQRDSILMCKQLLHVPNPLTQSLTVVVLSYINEEKFSYLFEFVDDKMNYLLNIVENSKHLTDKLEYMCSSIILDAFSKLVKYKRNLRYLCCMEEEEDENKSHKKINVPEYHIVSQIFSIAQRMSGDLRRKAFEVIIDLFDHLHKANIIEFQSIHLQHIKFLLEIIQAGVNQHGSKTSRLAQENEKYAELSLAVLCQFSIYLCNSHVIRKSEAIPLLLSLLIQSVDNVSDRVHYFSLLTVLNLTTSINNHQSLHEGCNQGCIFVLIKFLETATLQCQRIACKAIANLCSTYLPSEHANIYAVLSFTNASRHLDMSATSYIAEALGKLTSHASFELEKHVTLGIPASMLLKISTEVAEQRRIRLHNQQLEYNGTKEFYDDDDDDDDENNYLGEDNFNLFRYEYDPLCGGPLPIALQAPWRQNYIQKEDKNNMNNKTKKIDNNVSSNDKIDMQRIDFVESCRGFLNGLVRLTSSGDPSTQRYAFVALVNCVLKIEHIDDVDVLEDEIFISVFLRYLSSKNSSTQLLALNAIIRVLSLQQNRIHCIRNRSLVMLIGLSFSDHRNIRLRVVHILNMILLPPSIAYCTKEAAQLILSALTNLALDSDIELAWMATRGFFRFWKWRKHLTLLEEISKYEQGRLVKDNVIKVLLEVLRKYVQAAKARHRLLHSNVTDKKQLERVDNIYQVEVHRTKCALRTLLALASIKESADLLDTKSVKLLLHLLNEIEVNYDISRVVLCLSKQRKMHPVFCSNQGIRLLLKIITSKHSEMRRYGVEALVQVVPSLASQNQHYETQLENRRDDIVTTILPFLYINDDTVLLYYSLVVLSKFCLDSECRKIVVNSKAIEQLLLIWREQIYVDSQLENVGKVELAVIHLISLLACDETVGKLIHAKLVSNNILKMILHRGFAMAMMCIPNYKPRSLTWRNDNIEQDNKINNNDTNNSLMVLINENKSQKLDNNEDNNKNELKNNGDDILSYDKILDTVLQINQRQQQVESDHRELTAEANIPSLSEESRTNAVLGLTRLCRIFGILATDSTIRLRLCAVGVAQFLLSLRDAEDYDLVNSALQSVFLILTSKDALTLYYELDKNIYEIMTELMHSSIMAVSTSATKLRRNIAYISKAHADRMKSK